jgi:rhamnose utilization protein RhaD (predicted bifunctional aldolase and dehydrogenase)
MVEKKWALFPDHVVFLGEKALIGYQDYLLSTLEDTSYKKPPFIFCKDIGVFQHLSTTIAQIDQLQCFYDVAIRQTDISKITTLTDKDIVKLIDWDAEKYRLSITK